MPLFYFWALSLLKFFSTVLKNRKMLSYLHANPESIILFQMLLQKVQVTRSIIKSCKLITLLGGRGKKIIFFFFNFKNQRHHLFGLLSEEILIFLFSSNHWCIVLFYFSPLFKGNRKLISKKSHLATHMHHGKFPICHQLVDFSPRKRKLLLTSLVMNSSWLCLDQSS